MENLSFTELLSKVIHFVPHNESYVISGTYDVEVVDSAWILTSALFFFTMHTGLALLEVGVVSKKNQTNAMMKHVVDVCCGGFVYWMIGFGLMYGRGLFTHAFFGAGDFATSIDSTDPLSPQLLAFLFFQISFCSTSSTIFSAAVAERVKFKSYIILSMSIVIIYSIAAGWIWGDHGFLKNMGVVDFAGSAPIHLIGGTAALVGVWYLGPRKGRFQNGTEPLPMSNSVLVCTGLLILWWGWIGFNAGSSYGLTNGKLEAAARAGVGTVLSSMCAGVTGIILSMFMHNGKVNVGEVVGCILSGLVSINAGCYFYSTFSSGFVGFFSAILYFIFSKIVYKLELDDVCDVIAVHFINAIWGHLAVGLFASPESGPQGFFLDGSTFRLRIQTLSCLCLIVFSGIVIFFILVTVDFTIGLRLSLDEEMLGCDKCEHEIEEFSDLPDDTKLIKSRFDNSTLPERIYQITTPIIARRFSLGNSTNHTTSDNNSQVLKDRKNTNTFYVNRGYKNDMMI